MKKILVKFKHDNELIPYTTEVLTDLMLDNETEFIMDAETGELLYYLIEK